MSEQNIQVADIMDICKENLLPGEDNYVEELKKNPSYEPPAPWDNEEAFERGQQIGAHDLSLAILKILNQV